MLIKQIQEGSFDKMQIVTNKGFRPTRKNVIDQQKYEIIVGGVNYFPPDPGQNNTSKLDDVLRDFNHKKPMHDITLGQAIDIVGHLESDPATNWSVEAYKNALYAIKSRKVSLT